MPADKDWIYDPNRNPYHNCPAHHHYEVNLVSWRLEVSELELKYDDTEKVMIIDEHTLPCYFADGFCKPTTKTSFTLVWFSDDFCLIFTLQDKTVIGLKPTLLYILHTQQDLRQLLALKVQYTHMYTLHMHKTQITQVVHVLKYFQMLKLSVVNLTHAIF